MRKVPPELAQKLVEASDRLGPSFDDVRMSDIADASGIPRPTLYYYFAGKDEILGFLHHALLDDFKNHVDTAPGADVRTRLGALVRNQLEHLLSRPNSAQLVMLNLNKVGKLGEIVGPADAAFHAPFREILNHGIERGELQDIDVDAISVAMSGAVNATAMQIIVEGRVHDTNRPAGQLVALFCDGLRAPEQ